MSWGNFFCRSETNLTHKENDRLPAVQVDVSLFAFTNREEMKKPLRFFQETFYYPKWHFHEPHTIFLRFKNKTTDRS